MRKLGKELRKISDDIIALRHERAVSREVPRASRVADLRDCMSLTTITALEYRSDRDQIADITKDDFTLKNAVLNEGCIRVDSELWRPRRSRPQSQVTRNVTRNGLSHSRPEQSDDELTETKELVLGIPRHVPADAYGLREPTCADASESYSSNIESNMRKKAV